MRARAIVVAGAWHGFSRHAASNVWWSTRPACRSTGALAEQKRTHSLLGEGR
jgi:hypothetical protein